MTAEDRLELNRLEYNNRIANIYEPKPIPDDAEWIRLARNAEREAIIALVSEFSDENGYDASTTTAILSAIRARTPAHTLHSAQNGPPADPAPGQTSDAPCERGGGR